MRHPTWLSTLLALAASTRALSQGCCCEPQQVAGCADALCRDTVCALDAYCCDVAWDSTCANLAAQNCGQSAPYCVDANQDGSPDVCGAAVDPGDCDGDGVPDTQETGPAGLDFWAGAPFGSQVLEAGANWSLGRPGSSTDASVQMPYNQFAYDYLDIRTNCDNAVNTFTMTSSASQGQIRDFRLDLGGNSLAVYGNAPNGHLRFSGNGSPVIQRGYVSGGRIFKPTVGPLEFWLDDMYQFQFDNLQVQAEGLILGETADQPRRWAVDLYKCDLQLGSMVFALDTKRRDDNVETRFALLESTIDLTSGGIGLEIPNYMDFSVVRPLQPSDPASESRILLAQGQPLVLRGRQGSWRASFTSLRASLAVQGDLAIAGVVDGLAHCYNGDCSAGPGSISATRLVYPAGPDGYMRWAVDLSGLSPLGPRVPMEATSLADIGGILEISWTLNNDQRPQDGYSFPILRNHGTWVGFNRNFDLVRVWPEVLPDDYYVTVEWDGGTDLNLKVKQASPIATAPRESSQLPAEPVRTCPFPVPGGPGDEIVTVTNLAVTGLSKIVLLAPGPNGGYQPIAQKDGPASAVDMATGDLDGDGSPEVVVCHNNPPLLKTYRFAHGDFVPMWTRSYPGGTVLNCVAVIPPSGSKDLGKRPTGASIATGKTSQTGGETLEVVEGGTGAIESDETLAGSARTIRGTDIDDDDDVDVVAGGSSATSSLKGNEDMPGFVQVLRSRNGDRLAELPVPVAGVPVDMDVADLDADGLKDVVIACRDFPQGVQFGSGSRPSAAVLRGGPMSLRLPSPLDPGDPSAVGTAVRVVDADADGNPDIAVAWQGSNGGGASVFPVRERRAEGGVALGRSVPVVQNRAVVGLTTDASGTLVAIAGGTGLTESAEILPTRFLPPGIPGDLDASGSVDAGDIGSLLLLFGPCPAGAACPGDLDGSGEVDSGDIGSLLLLFS